MVRRKDSRGFIKSLYAFHDASCADEFILAPIKELNYQFVCATKSGPPRIALLSRLLKCGHRVGVV